MRLDSKFMVVGLTLALSLAFWACGDDDDDEDVDVGPGNIVEVASEAGRFTTLLTALEDTGLDDTLAGEGPFTVFAPTDAAFARLPQGTLASLDAGTLSTILSYHVSSELRVASEVVAVPTISTVANEPISVSVEDTTVVLNGMVQITDVNIEASNGIIHVVDAVLIPPSLTFPGDIVDALQAHPIFSTLVQAAIDADVVDDLRGDAGGAGLTLFAPTNFAFERLGVDLSTLSQAELQDVLFYHVVPDSVDAAQVVAEDSLTTIQQSDVTVSASGETVMLNDMANIIFMDYGVTNGVIHVIDEVLLPPPM